MSKFLKNLSWIMVGNVTHAVLQFLLNILIARKFGSNDFGLINYAGSIVALFLSVGTLGFNGIVTKKFAENEKDSGAYIGTAFASRLIFACASVGILQVIVRVINADEPILHTIVLFQSFSIVFSSLDLLIYWFRYKNEAKKVAIIRMIGFAVSALLRIAATFWWESISLYVLGTVLETFFFVLILWISYRKHYPALKFKFSWIALKDMLRISYPFISSAILATIYGQTDKIMLKYMVSNEAVGLYSVSLTLAGAIVIIPTALIEGFRPDIMSYKLTDEVRYRRRLCQLYGCVFWICTAYCAFITIFAKPIILLLYGIEYAGAIPSLALVVWYTSFSYFGAINNMYMVAEGLTKYVQLTTIIGALLNIILNLLLIPYMNIMGAALASLITQIAVNFVLLFFIKSLRKNFFIIIDGILLKWFKK